QLDPTRDCVDAILPASFCNRLRQSDIHLPYQAVVAARYAKRDLFPGALDANVNIVAARYLRPYFVVGIQRACQASSSGRPPDGHLDGDPRLLPTVSYRQ